MPELGTWESVVVLSTISLLLTALGLTALGLTATARGCSCCSRCC
jgi:hypothetical protein